MPSKRAEARAQAYPRQERGAYIAVFVATLVLLAGFFYVGLSWALGSGRTAGLGSPAPSPSATIRTVAAPSAVPATSPAPSPSASAERTHVVQAGDNPDAIARKYGVALADLLRLNGITDANNLQIGRTLRIPPSSQP